MRYDPRSAESVRSACADRSLHRWWVSWYADSMAFELHLPWWVSGFLHTSDGRTSKSICAAVLAAHEDEAKAIISAAHDDQQLPIRWRFVEQRDVDWMPFGGRFEKKPWMIWPEPSFPPIETRWLRVLQAADAVVEKYLGSGDDEVAELADAVAVARARRPAEAEEL